jgi:hypothetical protein
MGAIDVGLRQVHFSSIAQVLGEKLESTLEHARLHPLLIATVTCLIGGIPPR